PLGNQYAFRFNTTAKPFDNAKVRQALLYAFNQQDFLQAVVGDKQYYKVCKALFVCGTPLASDKGMDGLLESNFTKAQALLKEAGHLRWTHYPTHTHLAQWYQPRASRKNVDRYVVPPASVFWNISKTGK